MYGGHKQNFDGHDKTGDHNVYVFPQVYGVKCIDEETEGLWDDTAGPYGLPPPGYAEGYTNNVCILPEAGSPYMVSGGDLDDPSSLDQLILKNNTIYAPGGVVSVVLTGSSTEHYNSTFESFQDHGFDPTSAVSSDMPSNEQILAWGRQLLSM